MRTSTNKLGKTMLIALSLLCGIVSLNAQKGNYLDSSFEQKTLSPFLEDCNEQAKGTQAATHGNLKTPTPTLDLALTKELAQGQSLEVDPGDWVTFTVYIHNQGDEVASSVTITDYIPAYMTLMDSNWLSDGSNAYHIMPGPIAPYTTSQIDIHMMVNADAPHDLLMNCAEIGSASMGGVIVFADSDSTFDGVSNNDGSSTDNEINNNNNDEDDHDCAYVKVMGDPTVDPCPGGVVNCTADAFCTQPITPITICPDVCGINGPYTITNSESAYHCSLAASGGCITYTPVPGMELVGTDVVTLTIVADNGCTYNYTANVSIGNCGGNTFPSAIYDEVYGNCTGVGINPLVNDSDPDIGDVLTVCGFDQPANGTVTQSGDILYYMPNPGYYGTDEFLYTICDGNGGTAQANIIVHVSQCNSAPVASDDYYTSLCDKIFMYVLDNDYDNEGSITICDYTQPSSGTILFYDTYFSFIPAASYNGPVSFTYTVCDADGLTSIATVAIDVEQCNLPPVANDDSYTSTCEKIWMYVLDNDNDPDGGQYICNHTNPNVGTLYFYDTFFTYIPEAGYNGAVTFTYTLCDPAGLQSEATVTIDVYCNQNPTPQPDSYNATCEKFDMYVMDNDSDPDGGFLTICDYTEPATGSLIFNTTFFSYIPPAEFTGPVTFTYSLCDEYGGTASTTVTIYVDCGCVNPIMEVCTAPLQGIELCPDFCNLSGPYTLTNVHSTWDCSINQSDNGCVTYMPLPGFFGVDVVTLDACDEFGNCDTYVINVTVGDCNTVNPPQANLDVFNVACEATTIDVLANDINPGGGALTICDFTAVNVGTLLFNNNTFTYTPPTGLVGLVSFSYTVCNEAGESAQAMVTINYNCTCQDVVQYEECIGPQTQLLMCPQICSLNDYTFTNATSTYHCSLTIMDQCVQFIAVPGFYGQDIVTLTACDNVGNCLDVEYEIFVGDCNPADAPVAIYDNVSGGCNLLFIDVTANDLSPTGDDISICEFDQPTYGTVVLINGQFQYTPSPGFNGTDEFLYTLCTLEGNPGNSAIVTINVSCGGVNGTVTASDDVVNAGCSMTKLIVLFNDVSTTGAPLEICGFEQPNSGSVYQSGEFLFYTPNDDFTGNDTVEYTVCDDAGNADTGTVFINVDCGMPLANPPVVNDDLIYIGCEETYLMVIANDVSVDGDAIEICGYTQPANGTVWADVGLMLYTPNPGFTGTDTFEYMACDEQGAADSGIVTVIVECDAPCVDTQLEACTRINTPVDICVTFCSPDAVINDLGSTFNANLMQLNSTCFRYIASFNNAVDAVSASYCNAQGVCETIMVDISINDDCANPGIGGQPAPALVFEEKCEINFPSGFSPNGDGVNEMFRPLDAVNCYENAMAEVKIFNAHGQLLCESYDELSALSWNGKIGSSEENVVPGTYFYVITVEELESKETFKGFIELR